MDTIDNMRTFLAVVRAGSFSAAARNLGTVPSVVSKKISRLEDQVGGPLFRRSTRKLELTKTGERVHPRFVAIVADVSDTFSELRDSASPMDGTLTIKCPTTLGTTHFGQIITDFQLAHPRARVDLVLMDRSVNPAEEGFDITIGAIATSYPDVDMLPLCPYPRRLVAAPKYLERSGHPDHPGELLKHECLTFRPTGSVWSFDGIHGPVTVDAHARLSVNDSGILLDAAVSGLGIALVSEYLARPHLERGTLVEVLPDFPVPDLWISAWVPQARSQDRLVMGMCAWLQRAVQPVPPWDKG
ncbi:LysR family transcriptional regulator [Mesobacterium pallidum]|uniref:LysR family transcriptional regulator n=1 Tax=Mesobacterium pallidum TaxID=2872037 RepID=UPI001EE2BB80|nr:LysR family transcriptional regulator [Mesobacterium pallidum]